MVCHDVLSAIPIVAGFVLSSCGPGMSLGQLTTTTPTSTPTSLPTSTPTVIPTPTPGALPDFVLIPGGNMSTDTWNKLAGRNDYPPGGHLGGKVWDGIVAALTAHHYRVFAPTLEDERTTDLTGHIEQICTLIAENDLKDVILVGHSYGGMIITGVAARMPDRIRRLEDRFPLRYPSRVF
jgi:pimeloyl-ACP methyl ester carboxylesterase